MLSPISKAVAVLAAGVPLAHAINSFQFPSDVKAGKPTTLTINNDNGGAPSDGDSFRVSLIITPPKTSPEDAAPVCWLVNSTASDTSTLSITIPADVGPSGSYYAIAITDILADGEVNYIFTDNSTFDLEGGTADWSPAELMGTAFGDDSVVPCTSYNCVRNCTLSVDFADMENMTPKEAEAQTKVAYECMAACPGIHVPSWNETYGGEDFGGDDSDDSSSSSSSSSASGSPSAAPTASTKPTAAAASSPSTSTSTSAPTSGPSNSNSTVPVDHPNAAGQIAAGIPLLLSIAAGILLM